jgi:hypothetical protein
MIRQLRDRYPIEHFCAMLNSPRHLYYHYSAGCDETGPIEAVQLLQKPTQINETVTTTAKKNTISVATNACFGPLMKGLLDSCFLMERLGVAKCA